jgi:hypothetical protein
MKLIEQQIVVLANQIAKNGEAMGNQYHPFSDVASALCVLIVECDDAGLLSPAELYDYLIELTKQR